MNLVGAVIVKNEVNSPASWTVFYEKGLCRTYCSNKKEQSYTPTFIWLYHIKKFRALISSISSFMKTGKHPKSEELEKLWRSEAWSGSKRIMFEERFEGRRTERRELGYTRLKGELVKVRNRNSSNSFYIAFPYLCWTGKAYVLSAYLN